MAMTFIYSVQSEWLKKKHSAASWLAICGGFLVPVILAVGFTMEAGSLKRIYASAGFWNFVQARAWPAMGMFLLPMGVILATSLVAQLEFRNNTWKQLHTTPQKLGAIFFAKLVVIMAMMLQFFILFNIGVAVSALIPPLVTDLPFPAAEFPLIKILKTSGLFFIDCLPIIALQFLVSLQFKNFLVPIGTGLAFYVASMLALSWKYCHIVPYTYCALNFKDNRGNLDPSVNTHAWALGYFVVLTISAYILYLTKKEKG
jgi:lantibiotic transport system permease protein